MALLLAILLACQGNTPEPAPEPRAEALAEARQANSPKRQKPSPEDYGSDELIIPLLKFASDALPKTIEGLRPAGAPGEYDIDPKTFVWAGPTVRDGRLRYQQRRLRKATLNIAGRAACDQAIEAISAPHGEPQETACAERVWQTANFGIRYVERPHQAACSVMILVDSAFPPIDAPGEVKVDSQVFGVGMGSAIADFADITATDERVQVHQRKTGNPTFVGVSLYGPTFTFFDGKLEEVTIRANEDDCDRLRTALVRAYGPGSKAANDGDLNWIGCKTALEYRHSEAMLACRATARSIPEFFARVEWEAASDDRDGQVRRAEIEAHLSVAGNEVTVHKGILDWFAADPSRNEVPYVRKGMKRGKSGEAAGIRITGVPANGLVHTLGFRERDWIMEINGTLAHEFEPADDIRELKVKIRRAGVDQNLILTFEEGVLQEIVKIRGQLP